MISRFQLSPPHDPSKAFGKHHKTLNKQDFPKTAESAFHGNRHEQSRFQSIVASAFEPKSQNPEFNEDALNAFGKKQTTGNKDVDPAFQRRVKQDNFDDTAMSAFGKKVKKTEKFENEQPKQQFIVGNSLLTHVMNILSDDSGGEWTASALRKRNSKPSVMVEVDEFPSLGSKKTEDEHFPALGSVQSGKSKAANSSSVSFAHLVKKRAEEEAKEAEEQEIIEKKRQEALRKRKDETNRIKQSRVRYNDVKFRSVQSTLDNDVANEESFDGVLDDEDDANEEEKSISDNEHDNFDDYY